MPFVIYIHAGFPIFHIQLRHVPEDKIKLTARYRQCSIIRNNSVSQDGLDIKAGNLSYCFSIDELKGINADYRNGLAGFMRNTDIINEAELVVAFWDGQSKGTKDSIDKAEKQNKRVLTITFKNK